MDAKKNQGLWEASCELETLADYSTELNAAVAEAESQLLERSIVFNENSPFVSGVSSQSRVVWCTEFEVVDFVSQLIKNRRELMNTGYRLPKKPPTFRGKTIGYNAMFASLFIPTVYQSFCGTQCIEDFIEMVGVAFDKYKDQEDEFIKKFPGSQLALSIKQFVHSPLIKDYSFTSFSDLFISKYTTKNNSKILRFITLFMSELIDVLERSPYVTKLFKRVSQSFENQASVIFNVILHCLLIPLVRYPTILGSLPPTSQIDVNISEIVESVIALYSKYYDLPTQTEIELNERIDESIKQNILDVLNRPTTNIEHRQDPSVLLINSRILAFAAYLFSNGILLSWISTQQFDESTIIAIRLREKQKPPKPNLIHLSQYSPSSNIPTLEQLNQSIEDHWEYLIGEQEYFDDLKVQIAKVQKAIDDAESTKSAEAARAIESTVDLKRRGDIFADGTQFVNFVTSTLNSYKTKTPISKQTARAFFVSMASNVSFTDFVDEQDLYELDQSFLRFKDSIFSNLMKDVDKDILHIVEYESVFALPQTIVLKACLFSNPIESAEQLAIAMEIVEDIFTFEHGAPPEAHQLLPLLSNLFVKSPVPTPLSFAKWLRFFYAPMMERPPDWIENSVFVPLQHYFQFTEWIEEEALVEK